MQASLRTLRPCWGWGSGLVSPSSTAALSSPSPSPLAPWRPSWALWSPAGKERAYRGLRARPQNLQTLPAAASEPGGSSPSPWWLEGAGGRLEIPVGFELWESQRPPCTLPVPARGRSRVPSTATAATCQIFQLFRFPALRKKEKNTQKNVNPAVPTSWAAITRGAEQHQGHRCLLHPNFITSRPHLPQPGPLARSSPRRQLRDAPSLFVFPLNCLFSPRFVGWARRLALPQHLPALNPRKATSEGSKHPEKKRDPPKSPPKMQR